MMQNAIPALLKSVKEEEKIISLLVENILRTTDASVRAFYSQRLKLIQNKIVLHR